MTEINSESFKNIDNNKKILLDFWAEWCPHCKSLAPVLDKIDADNYNTEIYKINVDKEQQLAEKFNIRTVPTIIVMQNGEVLKRVSGFQSRLEIEKLLS